MKNNTRHPHRQRRCTLLVVVALVTCLLSALPQRLAADIVALPWDDSFNTTTVGLPPAGWSSVDANGSVVSTLGTLDGLCLYLYGLTASPRINIGGTPLADLLLTFQARVYNTTNTLIVGVLGNPSDATTFQPLDTLVVGNDWDTYTVSLRGAATTTGCLAFHCPNIYCFIDNVHLDLAPTCLYPTRLRLTHCATTAVAATWESDSSVEAWDLVCVPRGADPDAVVPTLTQHPHTTCRLQGLTPHTPYDLYVRSHCSAADHSVWVKTSFETLPNPIAAPWQSGFESDEQSLADWQTISNSVNTFIVGRGDSNTGNAALYISDDTASHRYDTDAATLAYAFHPVVFAPGYYEIAFDWHGLAGGYSDYGRAFLVPYGTVLDTDHDPGITATTAPDGWIPLDGSRPLSSQSSWQTIRHRHNIIHQDTLLLLFCWRCDGSSGQQPPFAIDNLTIAPLNGCFDPTDITVVFDAPDAGTLGWVGSDSARYHVKLSATPLTHLATDAAWVDTLVTQPTLRLTRLAPATTYHAYVQTTCLGQQSAWHHQLIHTPCGAVHHLHQHFEETDAGTIPHCWQRGHTTGFADPAVNDDIATATQGSRSLAMADGGYVVTPELADDLADVALSFSVYSTSTIARSTRLLVGVTPSGDLSGLIPVDTIDLVNHAPAAQQHTVSFAHRHLIGTGYHIVFQLLTTNHGMGYLDDISVGEYRPCAQPTDLQVSSLATDGAQLSWASLSGLTHTLLLATAPLDPEQTEDDDPRVVMRLESIGQTSVSLAGLLTPQTTYYAYVQSHCADSLASFWSGPLRFNTLCPPVAIPLEEHFDSADYGPDIQPICWTPTAETVGALPINGYTYLPYIYGGESHDGDHRCIRLFGYYAPAGSSKACLALPELALPLTTLRLAFSHRTETGTARLLVGVLDDPAELATFTPLDTLTATPLWKHESVRLDTYHGTGHFLALLLDGAENQATVTAFIDHVAVDTIAPCTPPVALRAEPLDGNTLLIGCETLTPADTLVQLQLSKVNATPFLDDVDRIALVVDTTVRLADLPLRLTALEPSTTYYLYGRVVCDSLHTSDRTYAVATTPCGRRSLPYLETFDTMDAGVGETPDCWVSSRSGIPYLVANGYANRGKFLSLPGTQPATALLPELDCDSIRHLTLSLRIYNGAAGAQLAVGVCDDDDPTTFVGVDTVVTAPLGFNVWQDVAVDFAGYTGGGRRIALKTLSTIYVDDLHIDYTQPCRAPLTTRLTNLTTHGVTATWSAGGGEQLWEVACRPTGVVPTTADTLVASPTVTLSRLQGSTGYTLFVRARCGNGVSRWVETPFRTLTVLETLPLVTDFEDPADNARWEIRKSAHGWSFGSAIYNSHHTAMYVSPNDGVTTSYAAPSTLSWATRTIAVDGGLYRCSFDWRCMGDTLHDFFRLFLLPTGTNPDLIGLIPPTGTIADAIAVDSGRLVSSTWNTFQRDLLIPPGNYLLAFVWTNDLNTHRNPPAAIDNLSLMPLSCYLTDLRTFANDSAVTLYAATDCPTVEIAIDGPHLHLDTLASLPLTLRGLTPETLYTLSLRGLCPQGDTTPWEQRPFQTLCRGVDTLPLTASFDHLLAGTLPDCWSGIGDVGVNTTYAASPRGSLRLSATANSASYAVGPALLNTPLDHLAVSFSHRSSGTGNRLDIGIMETPGDTASFTRLTTLVSSNGIWNTNTSRSLAGYHGTGRYLAFRLPATGSDPADFYLDDIVVGLPQGCNTPDDLTAHHDDAGALTLSFTPGSFADTLWQMRVSTYPLQDPDADLVDLVDTLLHTPWLRLTSLPPLTTCHAYVRTLCGDGVSGWTSLAVTTPCGVSPLPFMEDFSTSGRLLPSCWATGNAPLDDVLNAIQTLQPDSYYHWNKVTTGGLPADHLAVGVSGTRVAYWLLTPYIAVDTLSALRFDLALTALNGSGGILDSLAQQDDRFVVLASRDGGTTWLRSDILAEWNNSGSPHRYNEIATNGETVVVPLTPLVGDTVRLAFYVESTLYDVGATLHLGRVGITPYHAVAHLADTICEHTDYTRHGFDIAATSLHADCSPCTLRRLANDTLVVVDLAVLPISETELRDTMVKGERYLFCDTELDHGGLYEAVLTAANGCDSIVLLTLVMVDPVSLEQPEETLLRLTPNPVAPCATLRVDLPSSVATIELLTAAGQLLAHYPSPHTPLLITAPTTGGLYLLRLTQTDGEVRYAKVIVR